MVNKVFKDLEQAFRCLVNDVDNFLGDVEHLNNPIRMFVAGGFAINYWCGCRYTNNIDASFSQNIYVNWDELVIDYLKKDGSNGFLSFNSNYNPKISLLHEDYQEDSVHWSGVFLDKNLHVYVLNPVDLAVSKIARLNKKDIEDIKLLASCGLINEFSFRQRVDEALNQVTGGKESYQSSVNLICEDISKFN